MITHEFTVPPDLPKTRLDKFLAERLPDLSRARIQALIEEEHIRLNAGSTKPSAPVRSGDVVLVEIPPARPVETLPEAIPLEVLYEDETLIVLNKAAGLVVHPGAGNWDGTLVNALLHHSPNLSGIGGEQRPGIVHRLDKDTSGCIVVAKDDQSHQHLSKQFEGRSVSKIYLALVHGSVRIEKGRIETQIARHPVERKRMAVVASGGKPAITEYEVMGRLPAYTLVSCKLLTGRTHQIRVHMKHLGHPLAGDLMYGGKISTGIGRQMLHAWRLGFFHPVSQNWMEFEARLPEDFERLGISRFVRR